MKFKLFFPIGFKMVVMMVLMVVSATFSVSFMANKLFVDDTSAFIQKSTSDISSQMSNQTFAYLTHLISVFTNMTEMQNLGKSDGEKAKTLDLQYSRNPELISITLWTKEGISKRQPSFLSTSKEASSNKGEILSLTPSLKAFEGKGEVDISRTSFKEKGAIALSFPVMIDSSGKVIQAAVGLLKQDQLISMYGKKEVVSSYLVDRNGNVLAHQKEALVNSGANLKEIPIVKSMLESTAKNNQMQFLDTDGKKYLGAFTQVGVGGVGVISQILEERAFETARRVETRSRYISAIIAFLSISIIYFFSTTLTKPIRRLRDVTKKIESGDFDLSVKATGHDEITELTKSFQAMTNGLKERDKLKSAMGKFHGTEVADLILKGELKLGGQRRQATVFFSDIRGFTEYSERISPEEVVEMLNEYFKTMVSIITRHGGVVDKFIGDAIMAVWGAAKSSPTDTENAVRACLDMRKALEELNNIREKRKQPVIKIGMGLHSGQLIAGNIGSDQRMEFTVIGDTVNTASRIEGSTKPCGTDLLISEDTLGLIKNKFVTQFATEVELKGKAEPLKVFKVDGYLAEDGKPVIVQTKYSSFTPEHDAKAKVSRGNAA